MHYRIATRSCVDPGMPSPELDSYRTRARDSDGSGGKAGWLLMFRRILRKKYRRAVGTHTELTRIQQAGFRLCHQRDGRAGRIRRPDQGTDHYGPAGAAVARATPPHPPGPQDRSVATHATSGALASSRDALRADSDLRAYGPCHRRDGTVATPVLQ